MPRLFVGLEIPEEVRNALALVRGGLPGGFWINPDDFHVTTAFFGDVDGRMADDIVLELDRVNAEPFDLTVDGLDSFTRFGLPSTLYARIAPHPSLTALHAAHRRILRRLSLPRDKHAYVPHITLARLRGEVSAEQCAVWLSEHGTFRLDPFRVHDFTLFSARDLTGGGPYVPEERFQLP